MNNEVENEIRAEIEIRMNPDDFSLSPGELLDIINEFDVSEEEVVFLYHDIVEDRQSEIREDSKDVIDYFRDNDNYYPNYSEFKKKFQELQDYSVSDSILRPMFKKEIYDENQLSIFESIREEVKKIISENNYESDDEDVDDTAEKIIRQWGGGINKDKSAKLSSKDIFDVIDAGDVARKEIEFEFGDDEFMPMSDDEYRGIMSGLDENEISKEVMFKILDANGDEIKKQALVFPIDDDIKKGRVMGFGDDGKGKLQVIVSWDWPIDMKITNPEEMGKQRVYPEEIIIANKDKIFESDELPFGDHPDGYSFDKKSLYHWFNDALWQLRQYDEAHAAEIMEKAFNRDYEYKKRVSEELEEVRGLGHGVKNSGDRNVKRRDDNSHAPNTNLNESINSEIIQFLKKGKITKKELKDFINEQSKIISNKILK